MDLFDYVLDFVLIGLVVLQLRRSRFGLRTVLLPLVIAGVVGAQYLRSLPTAGNDLALIAVLTGVGAAFGLASGLTTRVWAEDGRVWLRAGIPAAALWIAGMGGRFAFQFWANHSGDAAIGRFSIEHRITSSDAWVDALVLMALAEVVLRVAVIAGRAARARAGVRDAGSTPAAVRSGVLSA